jgi:transcriptional regulator with XRE-family HTH domain
MRETMIEKKIGQRIQLFRKNKGLTQDKLSEMLGISPHYLSAIERGIYSVNLNKLVDIINYLDCTADDIFADVINNGYKVRSSRLNDEISELSTDEQKRIFDVIETMIKTAKRE